jgi:hypothetical protein
VAVKEGIKINHRVVIAMDALTASQKKALEPVLRDRQGFIVDASRQAKAVKGPGGNALYKRNAGHGFKLTYSIEDGSVIVQDVMKKVPSHASAAKKSHASAAKKSKASVAAKAAEASAVKKG